MKEKKTIYSYKVPEEIAPHLGESKVICVELIDELLSNAFGIHIIEPIVTFNEVQSVRPAFAKTKPRQAEAIGIMKKADEKMAPSSRQTNRSNLPKIGQAGKDKPKPEEIPKIEPVTLENLPKQFYNPKIN